MTPRHRQPPIDPLSALAGTAPPSSGRPRLVAWRLDWTPITRDGVEVAAGQVIYEITEPDGSTTFMGQPFRQGPHHQVPGLGPVWSWDGNGKAPTLVPSYVCRDSKTGAYVHLFLTAGRIELLADSTAILALEATP